MEEGKQSFADVWDIDVSKYNADADQVEEVVTEVEEGKGADTTKVQQDEVSEDTGKEKTITPSSDAEGGEAPGAEEVVEKQDEKSEDGKEDASTKAPEETAAEQVDETGINDLVDDLVKEELLDFIDDKDYSVGEKGLKEVIADTVEKRSTAAIETFKDSLGDDGKKLLEVLDKGGSVEDYVSMNQQPSFADIPLENDKGEPLERNQQYLVEDWLKIQGHTEDEISDMVGDYQKAGMIKKQAEMAQRKLEKWQTDQNQALLAQKEQDKIETERVAQEESEKFQEDVLSTRDIAGFKVSESKAKKLYDYITKEGKDGQTQFVKDNTPENQLLYAYFAMEGFDKDKLSKEIATKQARSISRKLGNYKDKNVDPKRGAQQVRKDNQETPDIPWFT